jgi:hypothetical protein
MTIRRATDAESSPRSSTNSTAMAETKVNAARWCKKAKIVDMGWPPTVPQI